MDWATVGRPIPALFECSTFYCTTYIHSNLFSKSVKVTSPNNASSPPSTAPGHMGWHTQVVSAVPCACPVAEKSVRCGLLMNKSADRLLWLALNVVDGLVFVERLRDTQHERLGLQMCRASQPDTTRLSLLDNFWSGSVYLPAMLHRHTVYAHSWMVARCLAAEWVAFRLRRRSRMVCSLLNLSPQRKPKPKCHH